MASKLINGGFAGEMAYRLAWRSGTRRTARMPFIRRLPFFLARIAQKGCLGLGVPPGRPGKPNKSNFVVSTRFSMISRLYSSFNID
ncbi:hypothetical protein E3N88_28758 [Mikania micrantha]|uniref:Uncharacterized protein n=1 Tax=Mikania micrantha TaxID=192012 RepID=A0A5N6N1I4_9ASTR|nr:hypothetical protein E3N88_28758 [Mikania micrantha]